MTKYMKYFHPHLLNSITLWPHLQSSVSLWICLPSSSVDHQLFKFNKSSCFKNHVYLIQLLKFSSLFTTPSQLLKNLTTAAFKTLWEQQIMHAISVYSLKRYFTKKIFQILIPIITCGLQVLSIWKNLNFGPDQAERNFSLS